MSEIESKSRRGLCKQLVLTALAGSLTSFEVRAEELPLIPESDPAAKAVSYVEDEKKAKDSKGNRCDTCSLYSGKDGAPQGPCQIFKGKQVKAAGWCTAWAPQM